MNHLSFKIISLFLLTFVILSEYTTEKCQAKNSATSMVTELSEFQFNPAPKRSGTGMRLKQLSGNSIQFAMTSAKNFGSESIIANFQYESMAQQKLVFRVKGRKENGTAFFHPVLILQQNGKTFSVSGPRFPANGGDWHLYVLGLDTDFQLGDARYTVKGLEFSFNSAREPLEKELSVEIEKIRFVNPNNITDRKKLRFQVHRAPQGSFPRSGEDTISSTNKISEEKRIAIYFDFDNNDIRTGASMSRSKKANAPNEYCGEFGFRDLLLENCPHFTIATKPEDADLIVYQRTVKSKRASIITQLARNGKPLVLYGAIPDPELADLAPLKLSRLPNDHFAPRENLVKTLLPASDDSVALVTQALPIQNCTFGRYFNAVPTENANVLLAFSTSKVPYLAQKGNILHFAGTSGTNLITSRVFYDKAALIFWSALTKKIKQPVETLNRYEDNVPADEIKNENGLQWRRTTKGFGRFGWLTAESGLVDSISSDLTVTNGDQTYRIDICQNSENSNSKSAPQKSSSFNKSDPPKTTSVTGTDPKNALTPLQGFCNEISKEYRFSPFGTDATVSLTMSLLSPFELWRFNNANRIFLTQENIADYAAWKTKSGVKIVSLKNCAQSTTIWDEKRDEHWTSPWMLLFREKNARPLLIVFPSQPKKIDAIVRYGLLDGLELTLGKEKTVLTGWPWGVLSRDCSSWSKNIPDSSLKKIEDLLGLALYYPIDRTEYFALDPTNNRIRFRTEIHPLTFSNDWKIDVTPVVCLPPLTAYLLQMANKDQQITVEDQSKITNDKSTGSSLSPSVSKKISPEPLLSVPFVQTSEKLRDFDIPTPFGPMIGKWGKSIEWTLPLPDSRDLLIPSVKDPKLNALQNKLFQDGVKWTCGGHVPLNRLSPERPSGPESSDPNISHFNWNFGIGTALQSGLLLDAESKKQLEKRVAIRTIEPMELYQYKSFVRHRTEPFSGLHYPVMFNSFYPNETQYEEQFGSSVIYGDTNEAATVVAWTGQELADIYGMADLIRANWSFYRYVMRHQIYIDDYCYQAGSCRESGAGAWIDMLNAEYSGLIAYARLAQIVGDEDNRAEALARAAKRAVPTIARICFKPWFEKLHPEYKDRIYLITGFGEDGARPMTFPTRAGNFYAANDLFDYSQGVPGTQFHLYRRYVRKPIEDYLREIAWPHLTAGDRQPGYPYLGPLALYGPDEKQINDYAQAILARPENHKAEDWPGMCYSFEIGAWLWRMNGQIAFSKFENLKFIMAQYDPALRRLKARYIGQSDSVLELSSPNIPIREVINSKSPELESRQENDGLFYTSIPITPGINRLEIQF